MKALVIVVLLCLQDFRGGPPAQEQAPTQKAYVAPVVVPLQDRPVYDHIDFKDGVFENFEELSQRTIDKLKSINIPSLFPIQFKTFHPVYHRQDVMAKDLTGSGKTLAFCLPCIEYFRAQKLLGNNKLKMIIIEPTRELALQVTAVLKTLMYTNSEFRVITVYGGVSVEEQYRDLQRGVDIFVGTTGRVLDHIERGNIDFSNVKTIVLDEADQMLKLGFKEDVERILEIAGKKSKGPIQKLLFSATIPPWIHSITKYHMDKNYQTIDLVQNLKNKTAVNVEHLAINCPPQNRTQALADILIVYARDGKTIVFTQTKADANDLILTDKIKLEIEVMHGDIAQNQREVTMKRFRDGKISVLVATDVASRGLDIPDVDLVIQVEPPKETESYIHRSGRTARAGNSGVCITFYTNKQQPLLGMIEHQAGIKFKKIGVPTPEQVIQAQSRGMLKDFEQVRAQVLPFFKDSAEEFLAKHDGDAIKALSIALAYCSGSYKQIIENRSLITGYDRQITYDITYNQEVGTSQKFFWDTMRQFFPSQIVDTIRSIKTKKSKLGFLFDIAEHDGDRFDDSYKNMKENHDTDFAISRCKTLPDLYEEGQLDFDFRSGGASTSSGAGYNNNYRDQGRPQGTYAKQSSGQYQKRAQNDYQAPPPRNDQEFSRPRFTRGGGPTGGAAVRAPPPQPAQITPARNDGNDEFTAFVGNLSFNITQPVLEDFFYDEAGIDAHAKIVIDRETGRSKGIAFVTVAGQKDFDGILAMSGATLDNRQLKINAAENRRD